MSAVTDEAVEAACRTSYGENWESSRAEVARRAARSAMRAALEAAVPYLAPKVDRDVWFGPLTALLRRRLELSAEYPTAVAEDADEIADAVLALLNRPRA